MVSLEVGRSGSRSPSRHLQMCRFKGRGKLIDVSVYANAIPREPFLCRFAGDAASSDLSRENSHRSSADHEHL